MASLKKHLCRQSNPRRSLVCYTVNGSGRVPHVRLGVHGPKTECSNAFTSCANTLGLLTVVEGSVVAFETDLLSFPTQAFQRITVSRHHLVPALLPRPENPPPTEADAQINSLSNARRYRRPHREQLLLLDIDGCRYGCWRSPFRSFRLSSQFECYLRPAIASPMRRVCIDSHDLELPRLQHS